MNSLRFELMSGGAVHIDLERCTQCPTQACVAACQDPLIDGPLALAEGGQGPRLRYTPAEILSGGCVECLACEQECRLRGVAGALVISLPIPGLPARAEAGGPAARER